MSKEKKVTIDVNREEVTIGILDYLNSNVQIETIIIWWGDDEASANSNKQDAIITWIEKQGYDITQIEWMECSSFSIETNACTLMKRKV